MEYKMFDFFEARTQEILYINVSQPENHTIQLGNKIEITNKGETTIYRIVDIVVPYLLAQRLLGTHLANRHNTRVYLELVSA